MSLFEIRFLSARFVPQGGAPRVQWLYQIEVCVTGNIYRGKIVDLSVLQSSISTCPYTTSQALHHILPFHLSTIYTKQHGPHTTRVRIRLGPAAQGLPCNPRDIHLSRLFYRPNSRITYIVSRCAESRRATGSTELFNGLIPNT
jgi:hypothetical protein